MGYSAIATARSALSSVAILGSGGQLDNHPLMKTGVHNFRPAVSKYETIWDADVVLNHLKFWAPAKKLTLS